MSQPKGPDLATLCVPGANLTRMNLEGANLSHANLSKAKFFHTKLKGATFTDTQFSAFEPNYPLNSYKNSEQTHAVFFNTLDDIQPELDRHQETNSNHPTLKAMVAHSLVTLLAKAPAETGLAKFIESENHPFFNRFDLAAQTPSLLRGLVQDTARGMSTAPLTPSTLKLCAYFLIHMPKLSAEQSDLLYFFSVKERKNALIQAISTDDTLKGLTTGKYQESTCALTQILNTRRHLFHTERKPNETASSKALFGLFSQNQSLNESGPIATQSTALKATKT